MEEINNSEPKTIITVKLFPDGHSELNSVMQPPMVVFILMQLIIQVLSAKKENVIQPVGGGIINFVRNKFRK